MAGRYPFDGSGDGRNQNQQVCHIIMGCVLILQCMDSWAGFLTVLLLLIIVS
jgi:hypothetical protein